jgi:transaldolase
MASTTVVNSQITDAATEDAPAPTLLSQLNAMTVTVCDTGDINSIKKFKPRDATTNPSLITAAAQMPEYRDIVDGALRWAEKKAGGADEETIVRLAVDRLAVEFGLRILEIVPGRVSTEVDALLSFDTDATVEKGRYLIQLYGAAGIPRERVLIKIASTWEGIRAAETLQKEGINCNLTLLFGMHQAVAAAEAGVKLISPFVGRILDWYKKDTGRDSYPAHEDPGVLSVRRIYDYYKKFGHQTEIMGASFRNMGEIVELAGCDLLTIAPNLLAELEKTTGHLERKLDPDVSKAKDIPRIAMDEAAFRAMHEQDRMAKEKLDEGIGGFSKALAALERLLTERLRVLHGHVRAGHAAREFFKVYDFDGDGFITREEWGGSAAVFSALDVNGDGRISPEELAAGLGGAFHLRAS